MFSIYKLPNCILLILFFEINDIQSYFSWEKSLGRIFDPNIPSVFLRCQNVSYKLN